MERYLRTALFEFFTEIFLMVFLKKLSEVIDSFTKRTGRAVQWLLLLMILVAVYNALGRYLGRFAGVNLTSNFFLEVQWYLFSTVFLLGASSALSEDGHVRVDVFFSSFSPEKKAKVDIAGGFLFLLPFVIFLFYLSLPSVYNSWSIFEDSPDPGGLPRYPIKTLLPVALLMLFFQGISEIIKAWIFLKKGHHKKEMHHHDAKELRGG